MDLEKAKKAIESLTPEEYRTALERVLDDGMLHDSAAGVVRQYLGIDKKPLSDAQKLVLSNHVEPSMVEDCSTPGCSGFTLPGDGYCPSCEIKFGT